MKLTLIILFSLVCSVSFAQKIDVKLSAALKSMESDPQFKHAFVSMYVVDSRTGETIFEKNPQVGMSTASCLKVVTSVSAFELLGMNYRYKTRVYLNGQIENNTLSGGLIVEGTGDPTLGSWRFESTKDGRFFNNVLNDLKAKGINKITGGIFAWTKNFDPNFVPGGWPWEDLGNYYGAAPSAINWHENQYDLVLASGDEIGKPVSIVKFIPESSYMPFANRLRTAAKGTGDNANIYLGMNGGSGSLSGTIPVGEKAFVISGAISNPETFFENEFGYFLMENQFVDSTSLLPQSISVLLPGNKLPGLPFAEYLSPPLDSINYFFLKRSVNLYGEALVKTIAYEKTKFGSTDTGLSIIKDFWAQHNIERSALRMIDGSGLSPANRVTTQALVTVMQYAKQQNWFSSFYNALPELNGIKMKDGYISGVRSFTGYVRSGDGTEYTFSFIVNNFDGSAGTVREKMWKVLDILK